MLLKCHRNVLRKQNQKDPQASKYGWSVNHNASANLHFFSVDVAVNISFDSELDSVLIHFSLLCDFGKKCDRSANRES